MEFTTIYSQVNYLDLSIRIIEGRIETAVYQKETDCNAFVPVDIYHYHPWIEAIPKEQFLKYRRNCSNVITCDQQ